jgi:hypothetical protein
LFVPVSAMNRDAIRALSGFTALTVAGRDLLEMAMDAPSRRVGESSMLSVSGEFPDEKLGATVQYESRGCEKYFVLLSKLDPAVHCILDQVPKLAVVATDRRGRRQPRQVRFDYIECGLERFALIEAKQREHLLKLKEKAPSDWIEEPGNRWRFLPGEVAAQAMGFDFRVFCPEAYPKAQLANLGIRHLVRPLDLARSHAGALAQLDARLAKRPHTVGELCSLHGEITGGLLYQAIEQRFVFGLLDRQLFDLDFLVYGTAHEADLHRQSLAHMTLEARELGPLGALHARASSTALAQARKDMDAFDADRKAKVPKNSTTYRQLVRLHAALAEGAARLAAFIPDFMSRGSHELKIDKDIRKKIRDFIKKFWKESDSPHISIARGEWESAAKVSGDYVPSKETFRRLFHEALSPEKAAFLAGGKRAFQAARPMTDGRLAVPELQIAGLHVHLDGVYGDRYSREFEEMLFLRPIYYPLVDDANGYVMARGVKIGAPSRMPVAMALRDCYQRNGWVPTEIIRDGGSEFANAFFSELAANLHFTNECRPIGAPRYGGRGESFHNAFNAHLQSLTGGSYFDQAGRAADGEKKGRRRATDDVAELVRAADHWIFRVWNKTPIGAETKSPEQLFQASLKAFPEAVVTTRDSANNRYLTSMPLGIKKFSYNRGIRWAGVRFSSNELTGMLGRGEKPTEPRLDVMEPSMIWAMTQAGPLSLHSLETERIGGMDIGGRLAKLKKLMGYNMTAAENQHARHVTNADLRREAQLGAHAAAASGAASTTAEPSAAPAAAAPEPAPPYRPDADRVDTFVPFARKRSAA